MRKIVIILSLVLLNSSAQAQQCQTYECLYNKCYDYSEGLYEEYTNVYNAWDECMAVGASCANDLATREGQYVQCVADYNVLVDDYNNILYWHDVYYGALGTANRKYKSLKRRYRKLKRNCR